LDCTAIESVVGYPDRLIVDEIEFHNYNRRSNRIPTATTPTTGAAAPAAVPTEQLQDPQIIEEEQPQDPQIEEQPRHGTRPAGRRPPETEPIRRENDPVTAPAEEQAGRRTARGAATPASSSSSSSQERPTARPDRRAEVLQEQQ